MGKIIDKIVMTLTVILTIMAFYVIAHPSIFYKYLPAQETVEIGTDTTLENGAMAYGMHGSIIISEVQNNE